jgi:hypothetical protein
VEVGETVPNSVGRICEVRAAGADGVVDVVNGVEGGVEEESMRTESEL